MYAIQLWSFFYNSTLRCGVIVCWWSCYDRIQCANLSDPIFAITLPFNIATSYVWFFSLSLAQHLLLARGTKTTRKTELESSILMLFLKQFCTVNWVMTGEMPFITAVKRTKENVSGSWLRHPEFQKKKQRTGNIFKWNVRLYVSVNFSCVSLLAAACHLETTKVGLRV